MRTFPLQQEEQYPEAWSYELLEGKALQGVAPKSCLLSFEGIKSDETVYNPCPFVMNNELCLLGRVEAFTSEISHVHQFRKTPASAESSGAAKWQSQELSFLNVQDPFLACINNTKIIGGVALDFSEPFAGIYKIENYRTSFYDFETKEKIIDGPNGMKDIRLVDLGDSIGVFTRPRSEENGVVHSSIQFSTVSSLEEITAEMISAISIDPLKKVQGFFNNNEWGGVNSVYQLEDGWLGVLGHIAYYSEHKTDESPDRAHTDEHMRKYAAIAFEFNPKTNAVTHPVIILARNNLATEVRAKREDLHNVIFPGGFVFLRRAEALAEAGSDIENVLFFYGLGDAHVGVSELPYPFHRALDQSAANNHLFMMDADTARAAVGL
ncbi:MAG: DUF1861 family protein [Candidatus Paceibacterota bacterium]